MKVTLICVGKIKEKCFTDGIDEYKKRLSKFCTFNIEAVADEKTPENAPESINTKIKETEGKRILSVLNKVRTGDTYVYALAIKGREYTSEEFSAELSRLFTVGKSHIIFIIGGSLGLSDEVLSACDGKLSFSKFTFPHQLMRLIFTEQLYRAFKIMNNEPYHK